MRRSLKKLPQNWEKRSQNGDNLHKGLYANFHKTKLLQPTQVFLSETLYVELPKTWSFVLASLMLLLFWSHWYYCLSTSFKFWATNFTKATKTANHWKTPETSKNHLQAPKTIHNHPKPFTQKYHPKPIITTWNHQQSARIYLELYLIWYHSYSCKNTYKLSQNVWDKL